ncbi:hypothetical protein [uncultured Cellulomonas sp.]|uniref:hypothetical protein n=1 Tax=uncultured Cellulomonas sp. TaxID=189682 RepID=UPI00261FFDFA|nr:hypothetical protein [uncultured Cellulomonas sp.]
MSSRHADLLLRLAVVGLLSGHAAVHGLSVGSRLGWSGAAPAGAADAAGAVLWFVAGLMVLDTAVLVAVRSRHWWALGGAAALVSQVAVVSAWPDAWTGTVVNAAVLSACLHASTRASHGSGPTPAVLPRA